MKAQTATRALGLGSALLVTGFLVACQDSGPTNIGTDVQAQFARGGKGNGGGSPTPEATDNRIHI